MDRYYVDEEFVRYGYSISGPEMKVASVGETGDRFATLQAAYDNALSVFPASAFLHFENGDYSVSGEVSESLAGAITEINATIDTEETISATGTIRLWNSDKETEVVSYTAFTNTGTAYLFTVSVTLTNDYVTGDTAITSTPQTITIDSSDDRVTVTTDEEVKGLVLA